MNRYSPYLPLLENYLGSLDEWRSGFDNGAEGHGKGIENGLSESEQVHMSQILDELTHRLKGNYPFHHSRYAGQMLKPPHPIAWLAYSLAMTINPNNHALDGGPPTSAMELEVVSQLATMIGFAKHLGHLTSGGTVANLEALWVARKTHPDLAIAFSSNAHYTHSRMAEVIGVQAIELSGDIDEMLIQLRDQASIIGTLVVTMGTTGRGKVEPLHRILPVAKELGLRIHVDAAYGGFFSLIAGQEGIDAHPWTVLSEADSVVIDPHKHGLQPYGCGAVLFRDPEVGRFYKHDSPYTYFTSDQLHLGEITLECSRAGASAAALWSTLKLFPLHRGGLGGILLECRKAALEFSDRIRSHPSWTLLESPELDIVLWFTALQNGTSAISTYHQSWFEAKMKDTASPWFVSLYSMDSHEFATLHPEVNVDSETVTLLRSVLMKPEHHGSLQGLLD